MQDAPKSMEQQRWELAQRSAAFGVWDLDLKREQVHYSVQWKALLGYPSNDDTDTTVTWRSRVHPDDLRPMVEALYDHAEGRRADYEIEFRLRAADGGYRWVLSRGRAVEHEPHGRAVRMVGMLTDLSGRREAQAVQQARQQSEAVRVARLEFLSRMSHEWRTPLNAVLGFAQLLELQGHALDAADQRRYVGHIQVAGRRLLNMVNDLLDLSGTNGENQAPVLQPVALGPLLREAVDALDAVARVRDIEVRLDADFLDSASVLADRGRLRQVLSNLLDNAVRFNRDGGRVRLAISRSVGVWTVTIEDTGLGIPAHRMQQLFEPFSRKAEWGPDGEGLGIGLLLARELLGSMGGRISVRSTEGAGSIFEFSLAALP